MSPSFITAMRLHHRATISGCSLPPRWSVFRQNGGWLFHYYFFGKVLFPTSPAHGQPIWFSSIFGVNQIYMADWLIALFIFFIFLPLFHSVFNFVRLSLSWGD